MAVAVLTGSITSYASIFGSGAYIQAVIAGQGIAGLTIAVGNLLRSLPSVSSDCDGEKRDELTHVREVRRQPGLGAPMATLFTTYCCCCLNIRTRLMLLYIACTPRQPVAIMPADNTQYGERWWLLSLMQVVTGAAIYFGACCFILLLCLVTFIKCERLPFTQLCLKQARSSKLATQFVAAQFHVCPSHASALLLLRWRVSRPSRRQACLLLWCATCLHLHAGCAGSVACLACCYAAHFPAFAILLDLPRRTLTLF